MALSRMKDGAKAEIERRFLLCKTWLLRVLGLLGDKSLMTLAWMKASASYELVSQEEGQDDQGRKTFVHLVRKKA